MECYINSQTTTGEMLKVQRGTRKIQKFQHFKCSAWAQDYIDPNYTLYIQFKKIGMCTYSLYYMILFYR